MSEDEKSKESLFYKKGANYWADIPATVDGVLGGYGHISENDMKASKAFLSTILALNQPPGTKLALDCGAGIGRISKNVLIPIFDKVDLVEQNERFVDTAKQSIGENNEKLGTLYTVPLQDFVPEKQYDVIWIQWVTGHLKDYDMAAFMNRCRHSLTRTGVIVVKENVTTAAEVEYDEDDSSVTRPYALMLKIFEGAQLKILMEEIQKDFPEDIYPVHTFALIPSSHVNPMTRHDASEIA